MDIIVMFAKLWGMETAEAKFEDNLYDFLEGWDSQELYEMFYEWKEEYLEDDDVPEDLCDFFYEKFNKLIQEKYPA